MTENVGRIDRIVRTFIGSGLIAVGYGGLRSGRMLGVLGMIGGALVLESALTRVCPLNAALGIDTRSTAERIRDFRTDVDHQTDRIAHDYGKPLEIDESTPTV